MDNEWDDIILDIQHIVTLAGSNPSEVDNKLLKELTDKMVKYVKE